jgi:hypothetical protein
MKPGESKKIKLNLAGQTDEAEIQLIGLRKQKEVKQEEASQPQQ